ncbi:MAG TPA: polyphosphate kinase 1 [Polyangiaceae bacterium]|nr:polyphosphate kinase 1 [Polyangiaceae bacterium]
MTHSEASLEHVSAGGVERSARAHRPEDESPAAAATEQAQSAPDLHHESLYVNRELSWLAFNARVLDQAADAHWPLLERLKFLAIFGSNLDEFFMIRVSGLHDQLESGLQGVSPDGLVVPEQIARVRTAVLQQCKHACQIFSNRLMPELRHAGIRIHAYRDLPARARQWARDYFRSHVFPVLTPLAVDPVHPFPFLSNLSLSLAVELEEPLTQERRFARVKVPESLDRFIKLDAAAMELNAQPGDIDLIALEELTAGNLADLFSGMRITGCWPFRVTRDMDLEILEDEAQDLLSLVDREVRRRRFGAAVRLELPAAVPERVRALLLEKLELGVQDIYETEGLLGLAGLLSVSQLPRRELRDPPLRQRVPPGWDKNCDPFALMASEDLLLHHPYESFSPVLDLLRRAAEDRDVLAIKMTLYRAGSNSEAVKALIFAAENGKQVAVAVELKARFDEQNNIGWARALERAGAHVFYGAPGLKTHAKALLIVRRETQGLRRYVHLSTGNYNAGTAKLYTDFGLLSTDVDLGDDVMEFFNSLSGYSSQPRYRKLALAPRSLRSTLLHLIEQQTQLARTGQSGHIFAKMNALVDPEVIRALYRASQAGVVIELLVRGVCCLRPQVPGVSENIRVFSLIGRFLEHERVCVFGPAHTAAFFLSSADWMPRNLDRRVEALFPVTDARLRERIRKECVEAFRQDTTRVYVMDAQGEYHLRAPGDAGAAPVDGQQYASERVSELDLDETTGNP